MLGYCYDIDSPFGWIFNNIHVYLKYVPTNQGQHVSKSLRERMPSYSLTLCTRIRHKTLFFRTWKRQILAEILRNAQKSLVLTVRSPGLQRLVWSWSESAEPSLLDHRCIPYWMDTSQGIPWVIQDPRNADWNKSRMKWKTNWITKDDLEMVATMLDTSIRDSFA